MMRRGRPQDDVRGDRAKRNDPLPDACQSRVRRPLAVERHHAGEGGLAALELPGEAADDQAAVLELGGADLDPQIPM